MTILFTILLFISDLIEFTYDVGAFTRTHIVPALIYTYCFVEFYSLKAWDTCTSVTFCYKDLKIA